MVRRDYGTALYPLEYLDWYPLSGKKLFAANANLDWNLRSVDIGRMCEHDVHIVARSAGIPTGGMQGR